MKLDDDQVAAVKRQTGADLIADDNPAIDTLRKVFGEHTFYLDQNGLLVPERSDGDSEADSVAEFVQVAVWQGEERDALQPIPPQATGYKLTFGEPGDSGTQG